MANLQELLHLSLEHILNGAKKPEDVSYLLAVSGGMDSMAMLHAFRSLGYEITVAHYNFRLRGEASDKDEELIRHYCEAHEIPIFIRSKNTKDTARKLKLSVQETARNLRYSFFEEIRTKINYDFICTAHHAEDQLETFFINLFRGSGLKGLTGIPLQRNQIIRPMLSISKSEIIQYTREHTINYREDESNKSDDYLRNRIRHHVTGPILKENPQYLSNALKSISHLIEHQLFIDYAISDFKSNHISRISSKIEVIEIKPNIVKNDSFLYLLKLYLLSCGIYPAGIQDFLSRKSQWRTGAKYEGNNITAHYNRERLWLIKESFYHGWKNNDSIEVPYAESVSLPGGDTIEWVSSDGEPHSKDYWSIPFNPDVIKLPLIARHRLPGDKIYQGSFPFYRKSLKKLFVEHQIPLPLKDRLYVITDADGVIISVPGMVNNSRLEASRTESSHKILFRGFINF